MPGLNQTGPMGQGPMTGRRMGKCTNFGDEKKVSNIDNEQENLNTDLQGRGFGRGFSRGFGGGRGFCGGRGFGGGGRGMGRQNRNRGGN